MLNKQLQAFFSVSLLCLFLSACSQPSGRYQMSDDQAPSKIPALEHLEDPIPRVEPLSRQGNKPNYEVRGKSYKVWLDIDQYQSKGKASFYGKKFHGHLTSNGEIYDMYSLSAAHKNLPLPSYVQVTNLKNGKQVVVRVNDRGPFHSEREIDLSYAAAYRLDMINDGVAEVSIKLIKPTHGQTEDERAFADGNIYRVQIMAGANKSDLLTHQEKLKEKGYKTDIIQLHPWHKLRVGPYYDKVSAQRALTKLKRFGYPEAFMLKQQLP